MTAGEVGLVISLITWAIILWNTRTLAFRTETRALCEKIYTIDASVSENAIGLWVSDMKISQAEVERLLIQIGRLEIYLQHLESRESAFKLPDNLLAEYRGSLTHSIESAASLPENEKLDAANKIAEDSTRLQQHIETSYLNTYLTFFKRNRMGLRK
tara:strand:- start:79 stop:549 length:471 start_codon:yes stop_codon:yes gene_type:complete